MPEKLSLRTRITDRLLALMADGMTTWLAEDLAAGRITQAQHDAAIANGPEKWDARGNTQKPFTIVVSGGEQETDREAIGNPPTDINHMVAEIEAMLTQRNRVKPDHDQAAAINESSTDVLDRWIARMIDKLNEDKFLTEPDTSAVLCPMGVRVTHRYLAVPDEPASDNTFMAVVRLEIEHDEFELNPYAGPSVPEKVT
ncbi:MAG: hypothetical protein ACPGYV_13790 [Phycisphaeraceae bacterium]